MDLAALTARLAPNMTVFLPEGVGPFPVCLQFHGCGGVFDMQYQRAEAARRAGVAAVVIDSLTPRGIGALEAQTTICTGVRFRGRERAYDVLAGLRWLEDQPWADHDRIAAAGWSHGAWAIMESLVGGLSGADRPALPFKSVILFYPYCGPLSRTVECGWGQNRPRVYGCVGGRDVVVGRRRPELAFQRLKVDGLVVETIFMKEAAHGFDEDAPSAPRTRYRADLARIAETFFVDALVESLSPTPYSLGHDGSRPMPASSPS